MDGTRAIVLVGHGAIPTDYPREWVTRLKVLEAQRRARGTPPTAEERELDQRIRTWPRTPSTDPYQVGLQALVDHLRSALGPDQRCVLAYNEFCAPTLEEAVEDLIKANVTTIAVVPSMLTPGGSHAELEIPESLAHLRRTHPGIELTYAWPFDLSMVARLLVSHLSRFTA